MREGVEAGHEGRNGGPPVTADTDSALDSALLEKARLRAGAGEYSGPIDARLLPTGDPVAHSLHESAPHFSAYGTRLSRTQWIAVVVVAVLTGLGVVENAALTAKFWVGVATALYVFLILFRFHVVRRGWGANATIDPSADELALLDESQLRTYSVLVPLFREKRETLLELFAALTKLDYPDAKLDGLLLVEDDDLETRGVLDELSLPAWMRVLLVPPGQPRTKPKALLYGLREARGEYLTIYDAEDKPDRLQLKKAAWAFAHADESVACLQAKLGYYNGRQNLLTRWFNLEYDDWFNLFLPGLHEMGAPIPLGGTSNHFDVFSLCESFAWDPHNVTEDADLGLRLARLGKTTAMLESTTHEEANSRVPNWLRQRSRWMKGYFQTILVHTRSPAVSTGISGQANHRILRRIRRRAVRRARLADLLDHADPLGHRAAGMDLRPLHRLDLLRQPRQLRPRRRFSCSFSSCWRRSAAGTTTSRPTACSSRSTGFSSARPRTSPCSSWSSGRTTGTRRSTGSTSRTSTHERARRELRLETLPRARTVEVAGSVGIPG